MLIVLWWETGMPAISSGAGDFRVIDGDDIEWHGHRFRLAGYDTPETQNSRSRVDRGLEQRRGNQARHRLQVLIAGARTVHMIPWNQIASRDNRQLGSLLIDGWEVAAIAIGDRWGVDYRDRECIDWGDPQQDFADELPVSPKSDTGGWYVVDGDTVARPDGRGKQEKFRLLGLNAPEITRARKDTLQRWRGEQAADRLKFLITQAHQVTVVPGPGDNGQPMHYDRRFAQIYLDGYDVADIAIREGWGVRWDRTNRPDWDDPNCPFTVPRG